METNNQTVKLFYARRTLLFLWPLSGTIFPLIRLPNAELFKLICFSILILIGIKAFLQYNMIYVKIGPDFITLKPGLIKEEQTVLFKDLKSIRYEPECVYINYFSEIENKELTLKIYTSILTSTTKINLLSTLRTIFKDKEK